MYEVPLRDSGVLELQGSQVGNPMKPWSLYGREEEGRAYAGLCGLELVHPITANIPIATSYSEVLSKHT